MKPQQDLFPKKERAALNLPQKNRDQIEELIVELLLQVLESQCNKEPS
jgi:hypothetical protein